MKINVNGDYYEIEFNVVSYGSHRQYKFAGRCSRHAETLEAHDIHLVGEKEWSFSEAFDSLISKIAAHQEKIKEKELRMDQKSL